MKVVLLLLLFFLPAWAFLPSPWEALAFYSPKCPKQVKLPADEVKDCKKFCEELKDAVGGKRVESIAIADKKLTYDFEKHLCACYIYKRTSDKDLYEWDLTCVYLVDLEKGDGGLEKLNSPSLPDRVPTRLAQLFLFSKNAFSDGQVASSGGQVESTPLKVALGGFYSIYARAIESFTYLFALYLVIIVSFWNFLIPGGIAFVRKLREGHVDFTPFISGELVSRSMVVVPAVAFFSLPVSVGGSLQNLPEYSLPWLLNLTGIGGVDKQQSRDFLVLDPCEHSQDAEKCRRSWREGEEGGGISWKVYEGGGELKVPLALALVREFVGFGLASADAAAKKINAVILAYQDARLKEDKTAVEEKKGKLQDLQRRHEESVARAVDDLVEAYSKYSKCIEKSEGRNIGREVEREYGCSVINNWKYDNPNCPASVHMVLLDLCSQLRVGQKQKGQNQRNSENRREDQNQNQGNSENRRLAQNIADKFGWLSPAVLPQLVIYEYFVSLSGKSRDPVLSAELIAGPKGKAYEEGVEEKPAQGGSWLDRLNPLESKSVRLDPTTAFVVGQALGITSVPPFNFVKSTINNAFQQGSKFVEGLANLVSAVALPVPWLAGILKAVGGSLDGVASFAGSMVSLYLSYVISVNLLKLLPFFVVSTVAIFRFLGYLFDLAKFVISLPFFAVGAATRNPASALAFFTHTVKLTGVPILIAFMPLVAFVGIELTFFFLYEVPVRLMLSAGGADAGMLYNFILGIVTGVLYVVVSLMSVKVAWELSNGFIDGVFSYVSQLVGHFRGSGGAVVPGR